jgi:uncharacterized protein DUF6886
VPRLPLRSTMTTGRVPTLWHASDDPNIEIFTPHRAPTAQIDDDLVWAIDEEHLPAYWFPRDCPRATFWIGPRTAAADAAWLNGARRVHAIEWAWWERFRSARVYLYRLPAEPFTLHNGAAGYFVSRTAVSPLGRREIDNPVLEHARAGIELRVMNDLWPLWDRVITSTLEFSGIRLRNARPRTSTPSR